MNYKLFTSILFLRCFFNTTKNLLSKVLISLIPSFFIALYRQKNRKNTSLKKMDCVSKKSIQIKEKTVNQIINGLQKLENENFFLNSKCNAYNMAKRINTNTTYLSKVMNIHYQKNFNTYINELRIQYIIHQLNHDKRYLSYNIQSLSEEVGYKSPDSFTKAFKTYTGLLPSIYIKNMLAKNELVNS